MIMLLSLIDSQTHYHNYHNHYYDYDNHNNDYDNYDNDSENLSTIRFYIQSFNNSMNDSMYYIIIMII